jgi:hypothetical protein
MKQWGLGLIKKIITLIAVWLSCDKNPSKSTKVNNVCQIWKKNWFKVQMFPQSKTYSLILRISQKENLVWNHNKIKKEEGTRKKVSGFWKILADIFQNFNDSYFLLDRASRDWIVRKYPSNKTHFYDSYFPLDRASRDWIVRKYPCNKNNSVEIRLSVEANFVNPFSSGIYYDNRGSALGQKSPTSAAYSRCTNEKNMEFW